MQIVCLMQFEHEVQECKCSLVEVNDFKECMFIIENNYALKEEEIGTMRCDLSDTNNLSSFWSEVCKTNTIFFLHVSFK